MYHKHDQISIHRNPLREYSTPLKREEYKSPKYHQIRIYFKCERKVDWRGLFCYNL